MSIKKMIVPAPNGSQLNTTNIDVISPNIVNNDSDWSSESEEEEPIPDLSTTITNKGVRSIYSEYLEKDKLLLRPEYQRELSWSNEKMITFIDTIYRGWIVPNYVIYKLSEVEKKENKKKSLNHLYECIDGQHRLTTIKMYIEGIKYPNSDKEKYIYLKIGNDRVFYNMHNDKLIELRYRSHNSRSMKYRNLTDEERDKFDNFQMSFHIIDQVKNGLNINIKCQIFNRLQNGEKVESYVKLRNLDNNKIMTCIRSEHLLKILNDIKFIKKIDLNKKTKLKHDESFNIYFLIRSFLIFDKKSLEINYLDINIRKYLEANNGIGLPVAQLRNDVNIIKQLSIEFITWISNNNNITTKIVPELCYIYACIYANYGANDLSTVVDFFNNESNNKLFLKFNNNSYYKKNDVNEHVGRSDRVTNASKMTERYNEIIVRILKKNISSNGPINELNNGLSNNVIDF